MALRSPRFASNARLQSAAENRPPLKVGETGDAVGLLQQALIDLGFPMPVSTRKLGRPDGIYGQETKSKLREFQTRHRLSADGIAGRDTLAKLDELLLARPGPTPPPAPPRPPSPIFTHRVRLHMRSISMPNVPEFTMLEAAERVYGPHGIKIELGSGQSLGLDSRDRVTLEVLDGECLWDQESDEQKLLFGQGTRQGVGPNDVLVYYVNQIVEPDGTTLNGCAGHEPQRAAVVIAATGSRWTLSHELGHVLLGPRFVPVHESDTTNVMFAPTTSITANPPTFTASQLATIRASRYCQRI